MPNESNARQMLNLTESLGFEPGVNFSIISFDNTLKYYSYRLSTVDWGMERLGYMAFHAIKRDLSIDTDGVVTAAPYVIDNGSVAWV